MLIFGATLLWLMLCVSARITANECGGERKDECGQLQSPNYPNNYDNNMNCVWQVVPTSGKPLKLMIWYNIEPAERSCAYDKLRVLAAGHTLEVLCGLDGYAELRVPEGGFRVRFTSDRSVTDRGFVLAWTTDEDRTGECMSLLASPYSPDLDGFSSNEGGCDFAENLCQWHSDQGAHRWFLITPGQNEPRTDPEGGHTNVLYSYVTDKGSGRVTSPMLTALAEGRCLHVHYYLRGSAQLRVWIQPIDGEGGEEGEVLVWQRDGDHGQKWRPAAISLQAAASYSVSIEVTAHSDAGAFAAIDKVKFIDGACHTDASTCGTPAPRRRRLPSALQRALHLVPRISHGDVSRTDQWPWMAHVRIYSSVTGFQQCGATLIAPRWLITAAHCLESSSGVVSAATVYIRLGERNLHETETSSYSIQAHALHIHPQRAAVSGTSPYDLALVELPVPVTQSAHVRPACLPQASDTFPPGSQCYASGWGTTETGKLSDKLLHANQVLLSEQQCRSSWGAAITADMLCANDPDSSAHGQTCQGDSGGPLVCESEGKWTLAGATSWGFATCGGHNHPAVYARISYFTSWIKSIIADNS